MDTSGRRGSLLYLAIGLLLVAILVVAVRGGESPPWRYWSVGLAAAFFLLSAVPAVREQPAHTPLEYGVISVVFAAQAIDSGSLIVGVFAVLMGLGAVVELYNWRAGTEYLRID